VYTDKVKPADNFKSSSGPYPCFYGYQAHVVAIELCFVLFSWKVCEKELCVVAALDDSSLVSGRNTQFFSVSDEWH
jgi:hypothetical protein